MTPEQQSALEGVIGRALAADEMAAIEPHLEHRNDVAIAAILSTDRQKLKTCPIGYGTVMEVFAGVELSGGAFLDALVELGKIDRDVFWAVSLMERGVLDMGKASTQKQVGDLKPVLPAYEAGLEAMLRLGWADDPFHFNDVSAALNVAEGRDVL